MKETRQIKGPQHFRANFDTKSIDTEKRTIDVVFVTERQVMTWNWDVGLFYEVLPCNPAAGDLTRLNAGAPVCDTHNTWSVREGLGVVEQAWFAENMGRATLRFSKRSDVQPVWDDVVDGIITGVSVGYMVYEYEEIGIKDNIPLIRANKWEATEISLALVQADPDSAVGRSADAEKIQNVTLIRKNKTTMSKEKNAADAGTEQRTEQPTAQAPESTAPAAQTVNEEQVRTQAAAAERTRISEITKAARTLGLPESFSQKLIDDGTSLDNARALIIDEGARKNPVEPRLQVGTGGTDEKGRKAIGMEAAIMQRAGLLPADKIADPGEYRNMSLLDIAKECLNNAGINTRGMTAMEAASRALQMQTRDGGGGLSSGDFSYILANVLNKTLRAMYDLQAKTYLPWTRKSTATSFKQMLRTQLSDIKLTAVQEGGEYTVASMGDSGETYKVAKWGKIVNIDWEAIVNDDLSAFSRVPTFLSGAVAQMQSDVVYNILLQSHKMYDGNELFDATNHGNLTSTGTAIGVNSLGVGRQMMRDQKSPGGNVLNIAPKFLLTGSQNEALALQYTSQNYVATKQGDINVWTGLLTPIIDARITGKQWFMVADPGLIDTVEWATLEGQEIYSESRYGFDVDALQFKVRSVFGAKAIDWRSLYKNAGA